MTPLEPRAASREHRRHLDVKGVTNHVLGAGFVQARRVENDEAAPASVGVRQSASATIGVPFKSNYKSCLPIMRKC